MKKIRYYIFLKDVFLIALTAFGGPQVHFALLVERFVKKRAYISEEELLELHALCQVLPGPTSTQTITAIGFKKGGPTLAYLTLLIWMLPAVTIMTAVAIFFSYVGAKNLSLEFTRFIRPMAVGFVAFAAFLMSRKSVKSEVDFTLMFIAAVVCYFIQSPWIFPALLVFGGAVTAFYYREKGIKKREKIKVDWSNFILFLTFPVVVGIIGLATGALPVRLFENFYRNGALVFGGGNVLTPMLYTEFVEFKKYLTAEEFLSGYAISQAVPGPVFSYSAFIGSLAMRSYGLSGEISGGIIAATAIFLPGTFLIFFMVRFWEQLKNISFMKFSLRGILATNSGLTAAAAFLLFEPMEVSLLNLSLIVITFCLLTFTKVPAPIIMLAGLLAGFIL